MSQASAIIQLYQSFNWSYTGVLTVADGYSNVVAGQFVQLCASSGITVLSSLTLNATDSTTVYNTLAQIRRSGTHIILLSVPCPIAATIFAQAQLLEMIDPTYAWVSTDAFYGSTMSVQNIATATLNNMQGMLVFKSRSKQSYNCKIKEFNSPFSWIWTIF